MKNIKFSFRNQGPLPNLPRKEPLSSKEIKKLAAGSLLLICLAFWALKNVSPLSVGKWPFYKPSGPSSFLNRTAKEAHVVPLLVNLKGEQGPQLANIHVHITLNEQALDRKFLSRDSQFKKHILFILSGQPTAFLSEKKGHFERRIQSQLNAFLTGNLIHKVRIQAEALN